MQSRALVRLAANVVVVTFLGIAFGLLFAYGQCLEPYVAGYVIRIPPPDRVWRGYIVKRESGREVEVGCFHFGAMHKLATAKPYKYAFEVEAKLSEKIPVSADISDDDHQKLADDLPMHPPGETWGRSYCFEMPGTIADGQHIRVSGHAEHIRVVFGRRFPFWKSITPTPVFYILPTHCYQARGKFEDCKPLTF